MKRNKFLNAALEELEKEVASGDQTTTVTNDDAADAVAVTTQPAADAEPAVTEVNIDQGVDAVAALMEKNASLQDQNASLEEENFDSDLDILDTASDSAQSDLAEAVAACEALEELAYIANLAVKSKQANATSVASLAFGLEQICLRAGLKSPVAGLEDGAVALYHPATGTNKEASSEEAATAQADAIGKSAMAKAKEIGEKLINGIKRIIGWIINVLRQFFTRIGGLVERIQKCAAEYDQIDESKTIDSKPFIASLRLVEGGGDANKQFEAYATMASKTLYGFFSDQFVKHMLDAFDSLTKSESDDEYEAGMKQLAEVVKMAMSTIFTTDGSIDDAVSLPTAAKVNDWVVGKTVPCVGGVQLFLAATYSVTGVDYCKAGLVANPPKFDMPESIPVVNKQLADKMFGAITKWLHEQQRLQKKLHALSDLKTGADLAPEETYGKAVSRYLTVLTSIATGVMPHLMRMNIQNSINFVAYVEKSIAVSKAALHEKK